MMSEIGNFVGGLLLCLSGLAIVVAVWMAVIAFGMSMWEEFKRND